MSTRARLLVVDDDRLVLVTLAHGLSQAGFEVVSADHGDEAILLARQHRPQLALLDIRMQGLSGFDVAQYLRDQLQVPFLFLSAFADADTRQRAEALGALDCLSKPIDMPRLVAAVERALVSCGVASPALDATPTGPSAAAPMAWPVLPVALGWLMHRHGCGQQAAWQHLQRLAQAQGLSPEAMAQRLVQAQDTLGLTGAD